jgi:hypothetical protein
VGGGRQRSPPAAIAPTSPGHSPARSVGDRRGSDRRSGPCTDPRPAALGAEPQRKPRPPIYRRLRGGIRGGVLLSGVSADRQVPPEEQVDLLAVTIIGVLLNLIAAAAAYAMAPEPGRARSPRPLGSADGQRAAFHAIRHSGRGAACAFPRCCFRLGGGVRRAVGAAPPASKRECVERRRLLGTLARAYIGKRRRRRAVLRRDRGEATKGVAVGESASGAISRGRSSSTRRARSGRPRSGVRA